MGDLDFKDIQGLPANEHAKKKAKEKSKNNLSKKNEKIFYTQKGSKVLKVICKANGAYSSYVGNLNKPKHKAMLLLEIKKWQKEGIFIPEHAADEHFNKEIQELAKK